MKIEIDKKTQERIKQGLEVVKGRIVKRGQYPMKKPLLDFLAEKYLIPHSEDSIGRGHYEYIIDSLFSKERPLYANSKGETHWSRHCLARAYQDFWPNHWDIMKKYLKRFFSIHSRQREPAVAGLYDFDPWDQPRPKDYPTPKEKLKASEKARRVGRNRLSEREKYTLKIYYEECKEEESEHTYDTLLLFRHTYGWKEPDSNFRYIVLFEPDLKEFWKWCGLEITDNLKFFLSKSAHSYWWPRKFTIPEHSPFEKDHHWEYARLKSRLRTEVKVPKKFFDKVEKDYLKRQLLDIVPTLSRIIRPLFLVAHFLDKEDPHIYKRYLKEIKFYLSYMDAVDQTEKNWAASQVGFMRHQDFLFDAVWQDHLFDRKRYLKKPKEKHKEKGRPVREADNEFVCTIVDELKKHKGKMSSGVYKTTGELIVFLMKDERLKIKSKHKFSYKNLGAEAVRQIYYRAK